jgi:hypothetical protein
MQVPLLIAILLVAGLLAAGFYSARSPARTDVPGIELPTLRERTEPKGESERQRPARVNRGSKETRDAGGSSGGGGGGSSGATPVPAPAPTPAGGGDGDNDDDGDGGDDASDDGDD